MRNPSSLPAEMDTVVFRSRVDTWLGVVMVGLAIVSVGVTLTAPWLGASAVVALLPLILFGAVLPLWVLASTDYTLTATELRVRSGPFRWRVPLQDVRAVTPTRNPLSSPALSLHRLRIEYGRGRWLMISPADKDGFLRELQARQSLPPQRPPSAGHE